MIHYRPKEAHTDDPIEERLVQLADEHLDLGRAPDLDRTLADSGIPSADALSFLRAVAREFNLLITAGDCGGVNTLRDVADLVDAHAG